MAKEGTVWQKGTQTFHGGQDWKFLPHFVEDFSVTTNGLGTPEGALAAATAACKDIHHYPPADFEPAISELAQFLWGAEWAQHKPRLLMGNGASELIDLVVRDAVANSTVGGGDGTSPGWAPGPMLTQYKEYERSSRAGGLVDLPARHPEARLTCIVNPTNPTGDYMDVDEIMAYIEKHCADGSHVLVDESMQMWLGPDWRNDSLTSKHDWITRMAEERRVHVFIMHSWTKIWSCTGVRLGSCVCPTAAVEQRIKSHQVPWSVNTMALAFTSAVVKDEEYLKRTWELTPQWHRAAKAAIAAAFPSWRVYGKDYLSWLWIDTGDAKAVEAIVERCKAAGVPVRSGKPGYNLPTYFRMAARPIEPTTTLIEAIKDVPCNSIFEE